MAVAGLVGGLLLLPFTIADPPTEVGGLVVREDRGVDVPDVEVRIALHELDDAGEVLLAELPQGVGARWMSRSDAGIGPRDEPSGSAGSQLCGAIGPAMPPTPEALPGEAPETAAVGTRTTPTLRYHVLCDDHQPGVT
jgi:hypothetical protein